MIDVTPTSIRGHITGIPIYLDTWAYIDLADRDPALGKRFLEALSRGGDILFSVTNACELAAQRGESAERMKSFLAGVGPRWCPAKMNANEIVALELQGRGAAACVDEGFFEKYMRSLLGHPDEDSTRPKRLIEVSLSLDRVVDLLAPQWNSISQTAKKGDAILKSKLSEAAELRRRNRSLFERKFPIVEFKPQYPSNFVFHNLLRIMAKDAGSLKDGDALDFYHCVVGCAFSALAALDSKWQARLAKLPQPNPLAHVYSRSELGTLVSDLETLVSGAYPEWAAAQIA